VAANDPVALAKSQMSKGLWVDAIKSYSDAIELSPKEYSLYYQRATCYLIINKRNEGLADLSRVLQLNVNQPVSSDSAALYLYLPSG
jgi:DnaJ homolog subfamily C member 3